MEIYNIWDYSVEVDKTATKDWYEKSEGWGCECGHCRNFLELVKQKQLPSAVTDLLSILGISADKPTYVCELYQTKKGHLYQFNYRVAGRILNDHIDSNESVKFDWGSVLCGHDPYPYGAPNFPEPHFDLMFFVELEWILNESENN